jgi:hypothetical protein
VVCGILHSVALTIWKLLVSGVDYADLFCVEW